jgi:hypothetical protein
MQPMVRVKNKVTVLNERCKQLPWMRHRIVIFVRYPLVVEPGVEPGCIL